jgi:CHAT domain-containing protein
MQRRAERVLEQLYEVLVDPMVRSGALAGVNDLVVVPHESLTYLPFAGLRNPATGRFLVEDFSILHAPSAAALAALRLRTSGAPAPAQPAVLAPFPESLPTSLTEARTVGRLLGTTPLLGDAADEGALRQALGTLGPVHVATHGSMNPLNPMFSRLLTTSAGPDHDGRLEVHEILGLEVGARLVFLSGCETGLGSAWSTDFTLGEDYSSLSQAFLFAGAENVISSLWLLEDRGADRFATLFYEALTSRRPTEALTAAQRAMAEHGDYSSPFYWAAYQISGAG